MMRTIHISEAANRFTSLLAVAEAGEEVALTRHGEVVARLVPAAPAGSRSCRCESRLVLDAAQGMSCELLSPLD